MKDINTPPPPPPPQGESRPPCTNPPASICDCAFQETVKSVLAGKAMTGFTERESIFYSIRKPLLSTSAEKTQKQILREFS